MRRVGTTELMLGGVVVFWALNLTASRYVVTHGLRPLAYSTVRYGVAAATFVALTAATERTLRIRGRDLTIALCAALCLTLNQIAFVYAVSNATASTVGLVLGATPIIAALIGLAVGSDPVPLRFWLGALLSFAGVGLVAAGAGSVAANSTGILCAIAAAATWAGYSVYVTPLMERYSPYRISAVVLTMAWIGMAIAGTSQTVHQDFQLAWPVWLLVAFAIAGPLVATNVLWFRSLHRIGPARATLAVNLQPFVAAVFAVVLLSEEITASQVAGGVLIGLGILVAARRRLQAPGAD